MQAIKMAHSGASQVQLLIEKSIKILGIIVIGVEQAKVSSNAILIGY
jgi:hypothetical protein